MKVCPHCEAELRNSVIRCSSCGRALDAPVGDERASGVPSGASRPAPAQPTTEVKTATAVAPAKPSSAWASSTAPPSTWNGAPTRSNGPGSHLAPDLANRRALPGRSRSNRPDLPMLGAALVTAYAVYAAWATIPQRWVQISLTTVRDDVERRLGTASFSASSAIVGSLAKGALIVLGVLAVLWLFFGLQRGWSMPWFSSPVIGIVASLAALGATIVTSTLWFAWRDAILDDAVEYGATRRSLDVFLENSDNAPIVELQRLGGPQRFGAMMALALAASCVAWWAYRKRDA